VGQGGNGESGYSAGSENNECRSQEKLGVGEEFESYRRCVEKVVESCRAQGQVYLAGRQ
jgi:hypothetical protein